MKDQLLKLLEQALNRYVQLDPEFVGRWQKLQGKVIAIELLPMHCAFSMVFSQEKILLSYYGDQQQKKTPQVFIKGTPLALLQVALTDKNRHQFFAEDVLIEGDAELAQQVVHVFDQLEIDWEEHLARMLGDFPTYHLGNLFRKTKKFKDRINETITQNFNEYLHEEKEFFPTTEALQDFFHEVDVLRLDVDRLDAKILHLQNKVRRTT